MTEKKKAIQGRTHQKEELEALKKEAEEQKHLADDRLTRLRYLQADFENYRKQHEKEKQSMIQYAHEKLIKDLLSTIDDLERAVSTLEHEKDGMLLVQRNFMKVLASHGLHAIEIAGKKFDPHVHEVVAKEHSEKEEGMILEEVQRGYVLHNKVLRPSLVKVATREVVYNG